VTATVPPPPPPKDGVKVHEAAPAERLTAGHGVEGDPATVAVNVTDPVGVPDPPLTEVDTVIGVPAEGAAGETRVGVAVVAEAVPVTVTTKVAEGPLAA
jgi:hypothetical protein